MERRIVPYTREMEASAVRSWAEMRVGYPVGILTGAAVADQGC